MANKYIFDDNDMLSNPTPRVPVCLCLDTSGSMQGLPIDELNRGVQVFYDAIKSNTTSLYSAEISTVTFGDRGAVCHGDFTTLAAGAVPPTFSASGGTPMGEAVNMALDLLEARKQKYRAHGIDYYQPWLVLMTDGAPNGDAGALQRAIYRTTALTNDRKLTVIPIGIGQFADMSVLARFSPKLAPQKLKGLNFRDFFVWLSQSVSSTAAALPGDEVSPTQIPGWGSFST